MKYILATFFLLPLWGMAQLDTLDNGKLEHIDSTANLKVIYPFTKRQINGDVQAYDLSTEKLVYQGRYTMNQRQGTWFYFNPDSGITDTLGFYNYLNDSLSGPFQLLEDSLRTQGNYQLGLLHGSYKQEVKIMGDSGITWAPVDSGQYMDSIPYGQWTYFKNGKLYQTGFYEGGKMDKNWITYDVQANSAKDVVMIESHYFEGKKTGNEKIHFRYIIEQDEQGNTDSIRVDEYEQVPWQDGKLMGVYYKKDKAGNVLEKGSYNNDVKVSTWTYYDPETLVKETKTHLDGKLNGPYIKQVDDHIVLDGTYAMGKKNNTWKYFDDNGRAMREEQYEKDIKVGEWKYFNFKGNVALSKEFENDELVAISEFNDLEVDVLNISFEPNEYGYELVVEELFEDSIETTTYAFAPEGESLNHESFMEEFKKNSKDSSIFIMNGGYTVQKSGASEVIGNYKMNVKDGNWDYFYNTSIIWRVTYNNGVISGEQFIEKINSELVEKGEYVLWYGPERPQLEFKIKAGVRHGKSTWYNKDGSILKEEKYKEGILQ